MQLAEAFPRSWLSEQIARRGWSEERALRWQSPLVAFALALLALGLPTARLLAETRELVRWTDSPAWIGPHLLALPLAKILGLLPSVGPERAWFLLNALCWAGTFPVMFSTCLRLGFPRPISLLASLVALAAPAVWVAGTLPSSAGPGLLASTLLLRALIAPWLSAERAPPTWRPAATWILACLLHASLVLLYPALVASALGRTRSREEEPRRLAALGHVLLAPVCLLALWSLASSIDPPLGRPELFSSLWREIRGGRSGAGGWLLALFLLAASFGPSIAGLVQLVRGRHKTRRSWSWLLSWCLFPLVFQALFGRFDVALLALVLGPLLPLGLAALLASWDPAKLPQRALLLAGGQLAMTVGFCLALRLTDPLAAWTRQAEERLTAEDFVLTGSAEHLHLLRYRFELPALDLWEPVRLQPEQARSWWASTREQVERAHRDGRRLVLERPLARVRRYPFERELRQILLIAPFVPFEGAPAEGARR